MYTYCNDTLEKCCVLVAKELCLVRYQILRTIAHYLPAWCVPSQECRGRHHFVEEVATKIVVIDSLVMYVATHGVHGQHPVLDFYPADLCGMCQAAKMCCSNGTNSVADMMT
jgi:hypothetical protein